MSGLFGVKAKEKLKEAHWITWQAAQAAQDIDIGKIVDRFLGWKLPEDFNPDCGISFKRESDYDHPTYGRNKFEPIGTNLFSAEQAKRMFEYALDSPQPTIQDEKPDEHGLPSHSDKE